MTREEAIQWLEDIRNLEANWAREHDVAIDMAIEALSEPSKVDYRTDESANIGTEVNDLISRADAIGCVDYWIDNDATDDAQARAVAIKNDLRYMPSAEPLNPIKDLISREAAIELVASADKTDGYKPVFTGRQITEMLSALPSADAVGVGRYENAMQKLREMPRYLNSIKEKQITKVSADAVSREQYSKGYKDRDSELVRCKDCRWWQDNNDGYPHANCHWCETETPDEDDFCSLGERKEP